MLNNIITLKPGWKFWGCESPPPPPLFFCTILLCIVWQELGWVLMTSWLETVVLAWVQNAILIIIQFSSLQKWSVRFRCWSVPYSLSLSLSSPVLFLHSCLPFRGHLPCWMDALRQITEVWLGKYSTAWNPFSTAILGLILGLLWTKALYHNKLCIPASNSNRMFTAIPEGLGV